MLYIYIYWFIYYIIYISYLIYLTIKYIISSLLLMIIITVVSFQSNTSLRLWKHFLNTTPSAWWCFLKKKNGSFRTADQGTIRNSVREELSETSRLLLRCLLGCQPYFFGGSTLVVRVHVNWIQKKTHPPKMGIVYPNSWDGIKLWDQKNLGLRRFLLISYIYLNSFHAPDFFAFKCDFCCRRWTVILKLILKKIVCHLCLWTGGDGTCVFVGLFHLTNSAESIQSWLFHNWMFFGSRLISP